MAEEQEHFAEVDANHGKHVIGKALEVHVPR